MENNECERVFIKINVLGTMKRLMVLSVWGSNMEKRCIIYGFWSKDAGVEEVFVFISKF